MRSVPFHNTFYCFFFTSIRSLDVRSHCRSKKRPTTWPCAFPSVQTSHWLAAFAICDSLIGCMWNLLIQKIKIPARLWTLPTLSLRQQWMSNLWEGLGKMCSLLYWEGIGSLTRQWKHQHEQMFPWCTHGPDEWSSHCWVLLSPGGQQSCIVTSALSNITVSVTGHCCRNEMRLPSLLWIHFCWY